MMRLDDALLSPSSYLEGNLEESPSRSFLETSFFAQLRQQQPVEPSWIVRVTEDFLHRRRRWVLASLLLLWPTGALLSTRIRNADVIPIVGRSLVSQKALARAYPNRTWDDDFWMILEADESLVDPGTHSYNAARNWTRQSSITMSYYDYLERNLTSLARTMRLDRYSVLARASERLEPPPELEVTWLGFEVEKERLDQSPDLVRWWRSGLPMAIVLLAVINRISVAVLTLLTFVTSVTLWTLIQQVLPTMPQGYILMCVALQFAYAVYGSMHLLPRMPHIDRRVVIRRILSDSMALFWVPGLLVVVGLSGWWILPGERPLPVVIAVMSSRLASATVFPALLYTRVGDFLEEHYTEAHDDSIEDDDDEDDGENLAAPLTLRSSPIPTSSCPVVAKHLLHPYRAVIALLLGLQVTVPMAWYGARHYRSSLMAVSVDKRLPRSFTDPIRIVVDGSDLNLTVTSRRGFEVMHTVVNAIEATEESQAVLSKSLGGTTYSGIASQPGGLVLHAVYSSAKLCQRIRSYCPLEHLRVINEFDRQYTSADGYTTMLVAELPTDPYSIDGIDWLRMARATVDDLKGREELGGYNVYIAGAPATASDARNRVWSYRWTLALVTVALMAICVAVVLRSLFAPLYFLVCLALTLNAANGIGRLLGATLWNAPVLTVVTIVALTVDPTVHLFHRIFAYHRRGMDAPASIVKGMEDSPVASAGLVVTASMIPLLFGSPLASQWALLTILSMLIFCGIQTILLPAGLLLAWARPSPTTDPTPLDDWPEYESLRYTH